MFYIVRNTDGSIHTVSQLPLPNAQPMPATDPELARFFQHKAESSPFNASDAEFVRVLEDLIDTLIVHNVIRQTDLPEAAQRKLMQRKGLRTRLAGALDLLGHDEPLL